MQALKNNNRPVELILSLREWEEVFLKKWLAAMCKAGYLKHTSAKLHDRALGFWGVMVPFFERLKNHQSVDFYDLIDPPEDAEMDFAHFLLMESRKHRFRGVTADMFLGCFKTFIHAQEDVIQEMEADLGDKVQAMSLLRRYLDVTECLFMGDWTSMTQQEADKNLKENARRLTLEKHKVQNILDSTRDLIFLTDERGLVKEMNSASRDYFDDDEALNEPFWRLLELEGGDLDEVLRYYPIGSSQEIGLLNESVFFVLKISPLSEVSMDSEGYMVFLKNISCVVNQREQLANRLQQRTNDLEESGKLFRSLFKSAGEGLLLVDTNFRIVEANQMVCRLFAVPRDELVQQDCRSITAQGERVHLARVIRELDEQEVWVGELAGIRTTGENFPMEVTVNRVELPKRTLFHVVVRDITSRKSLEKSLQREKQHLEEMNVTLRNVMKSIDQQKREMERTVSMKIETFLLGTLEKVKNEESAHLRASYLELIRDQLIGLTNGFSKELDARLLSLTRTEMRICQFIQSGSSSKDIAETLNLSYETVQTHRKNIRRKLGLIGQGINLYTYLATKAETLA